MWRGRCAVMIIGPLAHRENWQLLEGLSMSSATLINAGSLHRNRLPRVPLQSVASGAKKSIMALFVEDVQRLQPQVEGQCAGFSAKKANVGHILFPVCCSTRLISCSMCS